MKILVSAIGMGVFSALMVLFFPFPNAAERQAEVEEATLFEEEYAEYFGVPPELGTRLVLHRVQLGGEPMAMLGRDGEEAYFRPGDNVVAPCLRLVEIYNDAVLLDDCGAYHLLSLDGGALETAVPSSGQQGSAVPEIADLRESNAVAELVADYYHRLYRRPLSLRGQLDVVVEDDPVSGRRVLLYPGKDPRLFSLLPFKTGDQLKAINGISLREDKALNTLYSQLLDAQNLTLTLERNGRDVVVLLGMGDR